MRNPFDLLIGAVLFIVPEIIQVLRPVWPIATVALLAALWFVLTR